MKQIIPLLLIIVLMLFCGCNTNNSTPDTAKTTVSSKTEPQQTNSEKLNKENDIDIDLTTMSGTMVYLQLYDILYKPEDYIGEIIRIKGSFAVYEDEKTGNRYYSVLVSDATACCQNGIEFVTKENLTYPDDFPELNTEITVTGTINQYNEGGFTYLHLENSSMIIN